MFGVDHWGVTPDIMTLSKALGGGVMPVGAFLATPPIWDKVFRENPFIHTSTFGGGELACAAALAAIEATLEEELAPAGRRERGVLPGGAEAHPGRAPGHPPRSARAGA